MGFKCTRECMLTVSDNLYLGSFRVQKHMLEDWLEKLVQVGELYDDSDLTETDLVMETTQTLDSAAASAMQSGSDHMAKIRIPEQGTLSLGVIPMPMCSSIMHLCHGTTPKLVY